jgi:hypothetical protein
MAQGGVGRQAPNAIFAGGDSALAMTRSFNRSPAASVRELPTHSAILSARRWQAVKRRLPELPNSSRNPR